MGEQRFEEAESKLKNDRLTQIATIETALEISTDAINNMLNKNHQKLGENKERIKMEYEQRLSEQGISREIYLRYKEDIELLENEVKNLKAKTQDIKEYETWLSIYNIDDPKRRKSRNDKQNELESVNQNIRSFETKLKELRSEIHRTKQQFKESINTLEARKNVLIALSIDYPITKRLRSKKKWMRALVIAEI